MHKTMVFLGATAALGLVVIGDLCLPSSAQTPRPNTPPPPALDNADAGLVMGYKQWQRVNPKPLRVLSQFAVRCAGPTPQQLAQDASDPHNNKFVTVYVNGIGTVAMMHAKTPVFPLGTVIVKEKAAAAGGPPELLTVMRKCEKGYDPSSGDWQYLVLNGAATQVTAEGKLQTCQSCHAQWRKTDYVSRGYLPDSVANALR
jgi:hypothetical protein